MIEKVNQYIKNQLEKTKLFFSNKKLHLNIAPQKAVYSFLIGLSVAILYLFLHTPPRDFPIGKVFTISTGESLQDITENLYASNIIRSKLIFRSTVIMLGGEKKVIAGDYLLDKKVGPVDLAYRLVSGRFHLDVKRITIPEGWNVFEISEYLKKTLINFNEKNFLSIAKQKEGYLFPDTYFVSPTIKSDDIVEKMAKNFNEKIPHIPGIATTTYKFKDVVIMASIIEREARTTESRQIIAGILWKRLKIGMPLQVDAAFDYVNGKATFDLSVDDLKIDSPYNTYKYKGLPPGPIGNPGLNAIWSTINPVQTKYLYYLTGKDGKMYYAKTFEEHVRNKQKYLY
jgi:UPF0755 protein